MTYYDFLDSFLGTVSDHTTLRSVNEHSYISNCFYNSLCRSKIEAFLSLHEIAYKWDSVSELTGNTLNGHRIVIERSVLMREVV